MRTSWTRVLGAAIAAVAMTLVAVPPASAALGPVGGEGDQRIAGSNRYTTSVEVSRRIASPPQETVIVASGESFPDALAAGPVADSLGAPILLTGRDSLSDAVVAELGRLKPAELVVVGGASAVSDAVVDRLRASNSEMQVRRIEGANRYETAAKLSETFGAVGEVFVVSGENFADALAAGPAATFRSTGILLTQKAGLPQATRDALVRLDPAKVTIVGGSAAVSDTTLDQVRQALPGAAVSRIEGADRYATAARVASTVWPNGSSAVFLTSGMNFPDALSGTPAAAQNAAPILLTRNNCHPGATKDALASLRPSLRVHLGGDAVTYMGSATCGETPPAPPVDTRPLPNPDVVRDLDCKDFGTRTKAQAWFDAWYPTHGDVYRLDRDEDGQACESLPW